MVRGGLPSSGLDVAAMLNAPSGRFDHAPANQRELQTAWSAIQVVGNDEQRDDGTPAWVLRAERRGRSRWRSSPERELHLRENTQTVGDGDQTSTRRISTRYVPGWVAVLASIEC